MDIHIIQIIRIYGLAVNRCPGRFMNERLHAFGYVDIRDRFAIMKISISQTWRDRCFSVPIRLE